MTVPHPDWTPEPAGDAQRLRDVIASSRPAAIAGWPEYWARLGGLPLDRTTRALEQLVATGEVRAVALDNRLLYVADAPHMAR